MARNLRTQAPSFKLPVVMSCTHKWVTENNLVWFLRTQHWSLGFYSHNYRAHTIYMGIWGIEDWGGKTHWFMEDHRRANLGGSKSTLQLAGKPNSRHSCAAFYALKVILSWAQHHEEEWLILFRSLDLHGWPEERAVRKENCRQSLSLKTDVFFPCEHTVLQTKSWLWRRH